MAAFVWASAAAGNWSVGANWQVGGVPQVAPPTTTDTVTFGAGTGFTQSNCTLDTTGNVSTIIFTGYTGTFDYTGQTLNISGVTCTFVVGMTVTGNASSSIVMSGAGPNFTGASKSFPGTLSQTGSGTAVINGNSNTFVNYTRTGTAVKGDTLSLAGTNTITGTLTLGGNTTQGVNRLLVQSSTRGTQRTLTCTGAAVVINGDVDFMDTTITGSPSWTNTGSAYVGDCLGNGGAVTTNTTTPVAQTYNGTASDNWSTVARWTSRVPLPQDNCTVVAITAGTLSMDMPRMGANIDFTGTTRPISPVSPGCEFYGDWKTVAGMTTSGTASITAAGRSAQTFTTGGVSYTCTLAISGPSGTYTLQDDLTTSRSANPAFSMTLGTFVDNGKTLNFTGIAGTARVNGGTLTGTGTWNLGNNSAATPWTFTSGAVNASGATFVITTASANTRTFGGGGGTYGTLTYTVAGSAGQLSITGANTFTNLNIGSVGGAGNTVSFGSNTTITNLNIASTGSGTTTLSGIVTNTITTLTVTAPGTVQFQNGSVWNISRLAMNGSSGNLIYLRSTIDNYPYKFNVSTGYSVSFVDLRASDASGSVVS